MSRAGAIKKTSTRLALRRHKGSLLADRRGAVAFEMAIVFYFMLFSLLFPAADLAIASFQFISAWEALRSFGEYVLPYPPSDVTNLSSWSVGFSGQNPSTSTTLVSGYTISKVQVFCGDTAAGVACTSANITLPTKYYSYSTTVTLKPLVLKTLLCTSGAANPCLFTLSYSERFQ
jgi:Flp pilus assembly protein TadG